MSQTITATYSTTTINLPSGTTSEAARRALVEAYPELVNAEVETTTDGNFVFKVKSGKKG